ncbi:MAG TPA: hypothetical protein PKC67_06345 [Kiritimatiellia bacterium]|nr:hypothetical protein [Kiritimatiellia bacterium]
MVEEVVDLGVERLRIVVDGVARGVGGAEEHAAVPGNGEEDTAVGGLGDHQGGRATEDGGVEDEVDALAGGDARRGGGGVEPRDGVGVDAGGVEHGAGMDGEGAAGLGVGDHRAAHAVVLFEQGGDRGVVHGVAAFSDEALERGDEPAGVVDLSVDVSHAAGEAMRGDAGHAGEDFVGREAGGTEVAFGAGDGVVEVQAAAVDDVVEGVAAGDDEFEGADEVRGGAEEPGAFAQRFMDEAEVALAQVPHAAVDQLRAARGGAGSEVGALDEGDRPAAARGIERAGKAGGTAADDQQVVRRGAGSHRGEERGAVHA